MKFEKKVPNILIPRNDDQLANVLEEKTCIHELNSE